MRDIAAEILASKIAENRPKKQQYGEPDYIKYGADEYWGSDSSASDLLRAASTAPESGSGSSFFDQASRGVNSAIFGTIDLAAFGADKIGELFGKKSLGDDIIRKNKYFNPAAPISSVLGLAAAPFMGGDLGDAAVKARQSLYSKEAGDFAKDYESAKKYNEKGADAASAGFITGNLLGQVAQVLTGTGAARAVLGAAPKFAQGFLAAERAVPFFGTASNAGIIAATGTGVTLGAASDIEDLRKGAMGVEEFMVRRGIDTVAGGLTSGSPDGGFLRNLFTDIVAGTAQSIASNATHFAMNDALNRDMEAQAAAMGVDAGTFKRQQFAQQLGTEALLGAGMSAAMGGLSHVYNLADGIVQRRRAYPQQPVVRSAESAAGPVGATQYGTGAVNALIESAGNNGKAWVQQLAPSVRKWVAKDMAIDGDADRSVGMLYDALGLRSEEGAQLTTKDKVEAINALHRNASLDGLPPTMQEGKIAFDEMRRNPALSGDNSLQAVAAIEADSYVQVLGNTLDRLAQQNPTAYASVVQKFAGEGAPIKLKAAPRDGFEFAAQLVKGLPKTMGLKWLDSVTGFKILSDEVSAVEQAAGASPSPLPTTSSPAVPAADAAPVADVTPAVDAAPAKPEVDRTSAEYEQDLQQVMSDYPQAAGAFEKLRNAEFDEPAIKLADAMQRQRAGEDMQAEINALRVELEAGRNKDLDSKGRSVVDDRTPVGYTRDESGAAAYDRLRDSGKAMDGRVRKLILADGTEDPGAQYAIVPVRDVVYSHNAETFLPNKDFPGRNTRDYTEQANRELVVARSSEAAFAPEKHLVLNSSPMEGPTTVTEDMVALGGNERAMHVARIAAAGGDAYKRYVDALVADAPVFMGTDSANVREFIDSIGEPVMLVRVARGVADTYGADAFGKFNETDAKAAGTREVAREVASRVNAPENRAAFDRIAEVLGGYESVFNLNDKGKKADKQAVLEALRGTGLIGNQSREAQFYDIKTGRFTDSGVDLLERAALGSVVDEGLVARIEGSRAKQTLLSSVGALMKNMDVQVGNLRADVQQAVDLYLQKPNGDTWDRFVRQRGMAQIDDAFVAPTTANVALAMLIDKPKAFKEFVQIVNEVSPKGSLEADMFGELPKVPTKSELLNKVLFDAQARARVDAVEPEKGKGIAAFADSVVIGKKTLGQELRKMGLAGQLAHPNGGGAPMGSVMSLASWIPVVLAEDEDGDGTMEFMGIPRAYWAALASAASLVALPKGALGAGAMRSKMKGMFDETPDVLKKKMPAIGVDEFLETDAADIARRAYLNAVDEKAPAVDEVVIERLAKYQMFLDEGNDPEFSKWRWKERFDRFLEQNAEVEIPEPAWIVARKRYIEMHDAYEDMRSFIDGLDQSGTLDFLALDRSYVDSLASAAKDPLLILSRVARANQGEYAQFFDLSAKELLAADAVMDAITYYPIVRDIMEDLSPSKMLRKDYQGKEGAAIHAINKEDKVLADLLAGEMVTYNVRGLHEDSPVSRAIAAIVDPIGIRGIKQVKSLAASEGDVELYRGALKVQSDGNSISFQIGGDLLRSFEMYSQWRIGKLDPVEGDVAYDSGVELYNPALETEQGSDALRVVPAGGAMYTPEGAKSNGKLLASFAGNANITQTEAAKMIYRIAHGETSATDEGVLRMFNQRYMGDSSEADADGDLIGKTKISPVAELVLRYLDDAEARLMIDSLRSDMADAGILPTQAAPVADAEATVVPKKKPQKGGDQLLLYSMPPPVLWGVGSVVAAQTLTSGLEDDEKYWFGLTGREIRSMATIGSLAFASSKVRRGVVGYG